MKRILVTGASGQIGTELVAALRERVGAEAVTASDIRAAAPAGESSLPPVPGPGGPFLHLDCTDPVAVDDAVEEGGFDTVFHLAAVLSAVGERDPHRTWSVNLDGLRNVLEAARRHGCAVFTPSSIAAFGVGAPRDPTPQDTVQRPTSMYGVTKVAGELLCDYYHARFGVDTRGVRYPGIVSWRTPPGGGTTDWAVEIFHAALQTGEYTCFLRGDTQLDMMYMPDAIRAAVELMGVDDSRLLHRNAFNVTAMQLTPEGLAEVIGRHVPGFTIRYEVDPLRQAIADSWPRRLDDTAAREEWGWNPRFDVEAMVKDMLANLGQRDPGG
jgi:nucleoside-diphosphate-sugar epimerase